MTVSLSAFTQPMDYLKFFMDTERRAVPLRQPSLLLAMTLIEDCDVQCTALID